MAKTSEEIMEFQRIRNEIKNRTYTKPTTTTTSSPRTRSLSSTVSGSPRSWTATSTATYSRPAARSLSTISQTLTKVTKVSKLSRASARKYSLESGPSTTPSSGLSPRVVEHVYISPRGGGLTATPEESNTTPRRREENVNSGSSTSITSTSSSRTSHGIPSLRTPRVTPATTRPATTTAKGTRVWSVAEPRHPQDDYLSQALDILEVCKEVSELTEDFTTEYKGLEDNTVTLSADCQKLEDTAINILHNFRGDIVQCR